MPQRMHACIARPKKRLSIIIHFPRRAHDISGSNYLKVIPNDCFDVCAS